MFPFDLLIQVSATQLSLFSCILSVLMAADRACEDSMRTSLPVPPPLSSNVGSPDGSGHDLDGMASRSTDDQLKEIRELLLPLVPVERSVANFENHIQTITNSVVLLTSRLTTLSRSTIPFLLKWTVSQKWNRITASSLHACARSKEILSQPQAFSGSARSWNVLGQNDGSTAARSHGPGSSDDHRNTRRGLDTLSSTEDEQPRSAVLFQCPCEQYLEGFAKWI